MSEEAKRIQLLESRAAIADLVHGYALNVRTGKPGDCAEMFTKEATFEVREARLGGSSQQTRAKLSGRKAIVDYIARSSTSGARVCPLIHNLIVRIDGNDATSNCAMETLVWPGGQKMVGEYHDTFRYENGWRFSARVFTILGEFGAS